MRKLFTLPLPILECGLLDSSRISNPKSIHIKGADFIIAIFDGSPIIIQSSIDIARLFAISGMPARPSQPLILIPNDFSFTYEDSFL